MSNLRDQMKQDLELGGYAPSRSGRTSMAVKRLTEHFKRSPEKLSQKDVVLVELEAASLTEEIGATRGSRKVQFE